MKKEKYLPGLKFGDKFMLTNNDEYKYETPYNASFVITQCWTNGTVTLECGLTKLSIIYVKLIHIHLIQMLKILTLENMYDNVNI